MAFQSYKQDENMEAAGKMTTLLRLFSYLLAYKAEIILVLFIMGICVAITLINPLIIETAIDTYIASSDIEGLIRLAVFGVFINVIFIILVKIRMFLMAKISNTVLLEIRNELYTHIQTLDFHFFDSRPTGKILARIIGDVNSLKDVLSNSVTTLIPDFITICSVVGIMIWKHPILALASLSSLPFMILGIWFIQTFSHKRWQIHRKKSSNLNAFVHEDLSGIKIIKSFAAENETLDSFQSLAKQHRDSFMAAVRLNDGFSIIEICEGIGKMMLYLIAIQIIGIDKVSIGTLVSFGLYLTMFWDPISNLSNFYNQIITNIAGAERIFEILDTKPEIFDEKNVGTLPPIRGEVVFQHVSFSYDDNTKVLHDISFHIHAGETIAFVGATGAGKTTIVNLISRFYDIQDGTVTVDGFDIKKVSIESLRSQMGIMTQDNFLFSGTVKDNIRYGKLNATDEEIIEAAKAVHAHEFIMKLENGYDTELKERGGGLSIGQKQLLAFARTMVSQPKILILDEATSSIDTQTELLVQKGIESLLKGRTSFIIAHRLSTIQKADRIFVINHGIIEEQGSHEELLKKQGAYYKLTMAQFL